MTKRKTKIIIISGSPNKGSRLNGITQYAAELLLAAGQAEVEFLHVAELPPGDLIHANFGSEEIARANAKVEEADALIIASPVYKASYTGVLKTYLDLLPQKALENKPVLPLFIGGTISHLLTIDYALKPVLAALGARHILAGVFAVDGWVGKTEAGGYELDPDSKSRLEASTEELLNETEWRNRKQEREANRIQAV